VRSDHLDEDRIQALLHGELPEAEATAAREHAGGCPECSRPLEAAGEEERMVSNLLARLDVPAPRIEIGSVLAAASDVSTSGVRDGSRWNRRVAGVLLALGIGGAAYAIPGSPVRRWVNDLIPGAFVRDAPSETGVPGTVAPSPSLGGIAVTPGPSFLIAFPRPSGGEVRISLVEGDHVVVRAPAGGASYESGPDGLVIDAGQAPITFTIDIPRSAPHVEIRVAGARIFLKEGDRTEPSLPVPSGSLPLASPAR
jgi:hypothetical protein